MEYKRMSQYSGADSLPVESAEDKYARRDREKEEMRVAEEKTIRLAKLAAAEAFEEARELIREVEADRLGGRIRDKSQTAKNLATVAGIFTDKSLLLEGRPTTIGVRADATDSWMALYRIFDGNAIAATATEVVAEAEELPALPAPEKKTKKRGRPPKRPTP